VKVIREWTVTVGPEDVALPWDDYKHPWYKRPLRPTQVVVVHHGFGDGRDYTAVHVYGSWVKNNGDRSLTNGNVSIGSTDEKPPWLTEAIEAASKVWDSEAA
jgi:hypothetical protein